MNILKKLILIILVLLNFYNFTNSQIYNNSLTFEGTNNVQVPSVVSRAMGGVAFTQKDDPSLLFVNPAILQNIDGISVSISGIYHKRTQEQVQNWFPLLYYSNFSLLMEGLTRDLPDPDTIRNFPPNAGDSVQRPFDNILPNWRYKKNKSAPLHFALSIPFNVGGEKFSFGLGFIQYSNLNYYYANNNVLSPDFGSFRSQLIILPPTDRLEDSKEVYWYQTIRERIGTLYGYGGAISGYLSSNISLGISLLVINGESDDYESKISRGLMRMFRNYFGLYQYQLDSIKTGKSSYSGNEWTLSGMYSAENFNFGISVKPPSIIKRIFKGNQRIDTVRVIMSSQDIKVVEELVLPWRTIIGLSINLKKNLKLGVQLDVNPYSSTTLLNNNQTWSKPWLDGKSFRVGLEYLPTKWLALRGGFFTQTEIFEPEGNYNPGEPVSSSGYSAGIGYTYSNFKINCAIEYLQIKYEDKWATNVNKNVDSRTNFIIGMNYIILW